MRKSIILFLLMVLAYGQGAHANAVELRQSFTIDNPLIRMSDLFSFGDNANAGKAGNIIVGPAPAPGEKKVLNSTQLAAVARRHGVDWQPANRYERTVISRAGTLITSEEIEDAVTQILVDKGMDKKRRVKLSIRGRRIYGATHQDVSFSIQQASYNSRTGHLSATMQIPYGNGDSKQISLNGRVLDIIRIPVLSRQIKSGDVIGKSDIEWIELESRRVRNSFVTEEESLIGQQALRTLAAGKPVRMRDVRSRVLVVKGSLATLMLKTNRMILSVRVLAMENAGMGETVRVLNTRSKKTIEGIVTGAGRIVVPAMSMEQGS
ncbi:MAG: flagellar basal body P-ring formation protein FlgA [Rhodospirillales bacterium]|nr:flagellar basal body P-ring formation protein FlgA [Rhodospirillales bacterium]